jgi:hypothetical protein
MSKIQSNVVRKVCDISVDPWQQRALTLGGGKGKKKIDIDTEEEDRYRYQKELTNPRQALSGAVR